MFAVSRSVADLGLCLVRDILTRSLVDPAVVRSTQELLWKLPAFEDTRRLSGYEETTSSLLSCIACSFAHVNIDVTALLWRSCMRSYRNTRCWYESCVHSSTVSLSSSLFPPLSCLLPLSPALSLSLPPSLFLFLPPSPALQLLFADSDAFLMQEDSQAAAAGASRRGKFLQWVFKAFEQVRESCTPP